MMLRRTLCVSSVVAFRQPNALRFLSTVPSDAAASVPSSATSESSSKPQFTKEDIIRKALVYVDEYGWNDECLVRAVKELELPPLSHRIITRGAPEMVQFILHEKAEHVSRTLKESYPDSGSIEEFDGERLRKAIECHLDYLQPYHKSWAEALAISLTPSELPFTTQNIFRLSDDLCYYSGIRATRMDWYYERAVVTALYSATELFLLTDQSENFNETKYVCFSILCVA